MKIAAIMIVCVALFTGIAPQFADCQSQGKAIQLPNGAQVPMRCHWTARAEIALSVPLLLCGVSMLLTRRKDLWRPQALMTVVLGVFIILLPTVLIGVCARPDMVCRALMKPALILAGGLTVALGVLGFVLARQQEE